LEVPREWYFVVQSFRDSAFEETLRGAIAIDG
jgi:hypothetical protein